LTRRHGVAVALALALATLIVLVLRQAPDGTFSALASARPLPIAAGFALYAGSFAARAVRLNALLPEGDRLPFGRAMSLSAAATFLLQVIPFRGGEVASWASYKRALGAGWLRSGAVFALVKAVDTATLLLVGLAGAAVLGARSGTPALGAVTALFVAAGAGALLLVPRIGTRVLLWLSARLPEGSQRRRAAEELTAGLSVTHERPALFALSAAASFLFLAGHMAGILLVLRGLGVPATFEGVAFASLTGVGVAALLPSPAGTFGPMESGFAGGLAADGVPFALGLAAAAAVHVLTTAAAGLAGLPFLIGEAGRRHRETPPL